MNEKNCPIARIFTAPVLLRLALAVTFVYAGVSKFMMGFQMIAETTATGYEATFLPVVLVKLFMLAIPFIELILGLWLLSGFMRKSALASTGLLLIVLMFGLMVKMDPMASQMYIYLLVVAAAMKFDSEK